MPDRDAGRGALPGDGRRAEGSAAATAFASAEEGGGRETDSTTAAPASTNEAAETSCSQEKSGNNVAPQPPLLIKDSYMCALLFEIKWMGQRDSFPGDAFIHVRNTTSDYYYCTV